MNHKDFSYNLKKFLLKKNDNKKIQKKLKIIGQNILEKTYKELIT